MFQDHEYDSLGLNSLTQNFDQENRDQFRRPFVQPVHFSYNSIVDGASTRISAKGILTDISEHGSGILAHKAVGLPFYYAESVSEYVEILRVLKCTIKNNNTRLRRSALKYDKELIIDRLEQMFLEVAQCET